MESKTLSQGSLHSSMKKNRNCSGKENSKQKICPKRYKNEEIKSKKIIRTLRRRLKYIRFSVKKLMTSTIPSNVNNKTLPVYTDLLEKLKKESNICLKLMFYIEKKNRLSATPICRLIYECCFEFAYNMNLYICQHFEKASCIIKRNLNFERIRLSFIEIMNS